MPDWREGGGRRSWRRRYRRRNTRAAAHLNSEAGLQGDGSGSFSSRSSSRSISVDIIAVDIVVCHGLYSREVGSSDGYWSQKLWLEDLLQDYINDCRVLVYEFNEDKSGEKILSRNGVERAARELLEKLNEDTSVSQGRERPILFIAYDLAGIVIKTALMIANNDCNYWAIAKNTCRLLFFGTPHRAIGRRGWEDVILRIALSSPQVSTQNLSTLKEFSNMLNDLSALGNSTLSQYDIINIYQGDTEDDRALFDRFSATLDIPCEEQIGRLKNITEMCKFTRHEAQLDTILKAVKLDATSQDKDYVQSLWVLSKLGPPIRVPQRPCGQFNWIFDHEYWKMLQSSSGLCITHLYGARGAWNRDLSIFVFKALKTPGRSSQAVTYFSFDGQDEYRNNMASLFTSLTRQLLILKPSFSRIRSIFKVTEEQSSWTADELWILFRSVLQSLDGVEIFCVINALHECNDSLCKLLNAFEGLEFASFQLKVIFISGPEPGVVELLRCRRQINLDDQESANKDLKDFVSQQTSSLIQRMPVFKEFQSEIIETLHEFTDYLCISQAVETLEAFDGLSTPVLIRKELRDFPHSLSDVIHHTIDKLSPWAKKALTWVLTALRPLNINELAIAIALEKNCTSLASIEDFIPRDLATDLQREFGPLLRVERRAVHIYWQVQQYLKENQPADIIGYDSTVNIQWNIAALCMRYLSFEEFKCMEFAESIASERPMENKYSGFLAYAVQHWHAHYRLILDKTPYSGHILAFLNNKEVMKVCSQLDWRFGNHITRQDLCLIYPLHIAAKFGLSDIVKILLNQNDTRHITSGDAAFALEQAARNGHLNVVEQLLSHGINEPSAITKALHEACARGNPDMVSVLVSNLKADGPTRSFAPVLLCRAAQNGYTSILNLLLQAGAPIDATHEFSTPLHLAAANGQEETMECLLVAHPNVDARDKSNSTPLILAAGNGYISMVKRLVSAGSKINTSDDSGFTPLHIAAGNGNIEVVKYLLDAGADRTATTSTLMTPLHLASQNGHKQTVQKLLDSGPNTETVDKQDENGNTALKFAAENGSEKIVRILLKYNANVNLADNQHLTPLFGSIRQGSETISELLLDSGADAAATSTLSMTPLMMAANRGLEKAVQLLLERVTEIDAKDHEDRTALFFAAEAGNENIVRHLLLKRADPSIVSKYKGAAITQASREGYKTIVQLLLDERADVDVRDGRGQTVLQNAVNGNHVEIVRQLLDYKAEPNALDNNGRTALHIAATEGYVDIVQLLLSRGANPNLRDLIEWTPLHRAASNGNDKAAQCIMKFTKEHSAQDEDGWTPLHVAAQNSKPLVMNVLFESGADLQVRTYNNDTPLHFSSRSPVSTKWLLDHNVDVDPYNNNHETPLMQASREMGDAKVVEMLLKHAADPNARNNEGSTALTIAAREGSKEMLEILLLQRPLIADVTAQDVHGNAALQLASFAGFEEKVKLLIECGAELNLKDYYGNTALSSAAYRGQLGTAKILLDSGADIEAENEAGLTPLLLAIQRNKQEVSKLLIARGANVNAKGHDSASAMHLAAERNMVEIVHLLLEHKANFNATGGRYHSILQAAVVGRGKEVVEDLVGEGIDVNTHGGMYGDALCAAGAEFPEVIPILLNAGAKADGTDAQGRMALHNAARSGRLLSLLKELGNSGGISLARVDSQGRNVLHHASTGGHVTLVRQLLRTRDLRMKDRMVPSPSAEPRTRQGSVDFAGSSRERHPLDVPDNDGWEALHWACRGDNPKLVVMLLDAGSDPGLKGKRGWTPWLVAHFHGRKALCDILEKRAGERIERPANLDEGAPTTRVCDGCRLHIYGIQYICKECKDFYFCFKCFWSAKTTHPEHAFEREGRGPRTVPEWTDDGAYSSKEDDDDYDSSGER